MTHTVSSFVSIILEVYSVPSIYLDEEERKRGLYMGGLKMVSPYCSHPIG